MNQKSARKWMRKNEYKIKKINTGLERSDKQFDKNYKLAMSTLSK